MRAIESAEISTTIVPMDIRPLIYEIRGRQVMLDRDLAALYGVLTKNLNKAVKRNVERFPSVNLDFSSAMPNGDLKSQFATSSVSLLFVRKGKGRDF